MEIPRSCDVCSADRAPNDQRRVTLARQAVSAAASFFALPKVASARETSCIRHYIALHKQLQDYGRTMLTCAVSCGTVPSNTRNATGLERTFTLAAVSVVERLTRASMHCIAGWSSEMTRPA